MTFDPSSREAEAQAEIAATRLERGVAWLLVAGSAALLSSGPLVEVAAAWRGDSAITDRFAAPAANAGRLEVARQRIDEVETRFDERSSLVRWLRPRTQALLLRFGGYGNEQAIAGRHGWLFFRDDVEHLTSRRPGDGFAGDPVEAIRSFRDALAARGIALLVVPTPLKPTVHPEHLSRRSSPAPIRRDTEAGLLADLTATDVLVLDLADRFALETRLRPLYLATDTHWRPEAVEIAAREIALTLRGETSLSAGDSARRESPADRRSARGDTAAMLELEESSPIVLAETVTTLPPSRQTTARDSERAEVLLLGDSFSAIYSSPDLGWGAGAGLADRLSAQLGLAVDRIVRNAGGASETRRALAELWRSDPGRFAGLRVVVWQFAARELSQGKWSTVSLPPPERAPISGQTPSSE